MTTKTNRPRCPMCRSRKTRLTGYGRCDPQFDWSNWTEWKCVKCGFPFHREEPSAKHVDAIRAEEKFLYSTVCGAATSVRAIPHQQKPSVIVGGETVKQLSYGNTVETNDVVLLPSDDLCDGETRTPRPIVPYTAECAPPRTLSPRWIPHAAPDPLLYADLLKERLAIVDDLNAETWMERKKWLAGLLAGYDMALASGGKHLGQIRTETNIEQYKRGHDEKMVGGVFVDDFFRFYEYGPEKKETHNA